MTTPAIIVALDVPGAREATRLVDQLPDQIGWYKIGLELFCAEGPTIVRALKTKGKRVFLDLKLHDIPRTVARTVEALAHLEIDLLTVHAAGGAAMLREAAKAAAKSPHRPKIVAVTVLTSLNRRDLELIGVQKDTDEQALALGRLAMAEGLDGLVCSAREVAVLRAVIGPEPILVTPGIRLPANAVGDQKRVASPSQAVRDGASFLVVGRPIVEAPDPASAALQFLHEVSSTKVP